jgi:hypothetical protein
MKIYISWNVTAFNAPDVNQRFGATYHLHLQDRNSGASYQRGISQHADLFEVLTTVFMKASYCVRFEVFIAVTMSNGVSWDVTPCSSCKNRHFGGT